MRSRSARQTVAALTGTVEQPSVRTTRLRAATHDACDPVQRCDHDQQFQPRLGNASISVTVAFQEDSDRVAAVLREIANAMRHDLLISAVDARDLKLLGVDAVKATGVTTRRDPCTAAGRWAVREFNAARERFRAWHRAQQRWKCRRRWSRSHSHPQNGQAIAAYIAGAPHRAQPPRSSKWRAAALPIGSTLRSAPAMSPPAVLSAKPRRAGAAKGRRLYDRRQARAAPLRSPTAPPRTA
jgi:hypothetical protein